MEQVGRLDNKAELRESGSQRRIYRRDKSSVTSNDKRVVVYDKEQRDSDEKETTAGEKTKEKRMKEMSCRLVKILARTEINEDGEEIVNVTWPQREVEAGAGSKISEISETSSIGNKEAGSASKINNSQNEENNKNENNKERKSGSKNKDNNKEDKSNLGENNKSKNAGSSLRSNKDNEPQVNNKSGSNNDHYCNKEGNNKSHGNNGQGNNKYGDKYDSDRSSYDSGCSSRDMRGSSQSYSGGYRNNSDSRESNQSSSEWNRNSSDLRKLDRNYNEWNNDNFGRDGRCQQDNRSRCSKFKSSRESSSYDNNRGDYYHKQQPSYFDKHGRPIYSYDDKSIYRGTNNNNINDQDRQESTRDGQKSNDKSGSKINSCFVNKINNHGKRPREESKEKSRDVKRDDQKKNIESDDKNKRNENKKDDKDKNIEKANDNKRNRVECPQKMVAQEVTKSTSSEVPAVGVVAAAGERDRNNENSAFKIITNMKKNENKILTTDTVTEASLEDLDEDEMNGLIGEDTPNSQMNVTNNNDEINNSSIEVMEIEVESRESPISASKIIKEPGISINNNGIKSNNARSTLTMVVNETKMIDSNKEMGKEDHGESSGELTGLVNQPNEEIVEDESGEAVKNVCKTVTEMMINQVETIERLVENKNVRSTDQRIINEKEKESANKGWPNDVISSKATGSDDLFDCLFNSKYESKHMRNQKQRVRRMETDQEG